MQPYKWIHTSSERGAGPENLSVEKDITLCTTFTHLYATTSPLPGCLTPKCQYTHTQPLKCYLLGQLNFTTAASTHMAISPHFHLHVINSSSAQRRVKQLHVGRPKHVTTQKKRYGGARERKRKETKFVDTRFCHAGAVCRPARAQRPELKLRNTDRLSQLLPYTHPPSLSSPPLYILSFIYPFHLFLYCPSLSSRPKPSRRFSATHSVPTPLSSSSSASSPLRPSLSAHRPLSLCCSGHFYSWADTQAAQTRKRLHKNASPACSNYPANALNSTKMQADFNRTWSSSDSSDAVEWPFKCLWTPDR